MTLYRSAPELPQAVRRTPDVRFARPGRSRAVARQSLDGPASSCTARETATGRSDGKIGTYRGYDRACRFLREPAGVSG